MTLSFPAHFYPDSGCYSVEFPDLPGCLTFGDTIDEAKAYAAQALTGFLECMVDDGDPLPVPSDSADLHFPSGFVFPVAVDIDFPADGAV